MKYILEQFKKLTAINSPSGFTQEAAKYTYKQLEDMGFKTWITKKGCVAADLGGSGNPIVLAAHIDTLGGMVAEIKGNGRLRITRIGGLQANNIETENCKVFTRFGKVYDGCCQLVNASSHVNADYAKTCRDFDNVEILLDEISDSKEQTKKLGISVGDFVCFDPRTVVTESGYVKSRFIDDKMSVAILLGYAKHVADSVINLPRKVYLYITVYEEVGHGCSNLPFEADEILCVDMGCVGNGLECTERKVSICAKDSHGPYNYDMTTKLIRLAKENKLDYAVDIYPYYGSDGDAALDAGKDIRHGLIGSGVYASHGYERTHIDGIKNTYELINKYID